MKLEGSDIINYLNMSSKKTFTLYYSCSATGVISAG